MKDIKKSIQLPLSKEVAFDKFVNHLNAWWPKEYTWSQEKLSAITIDPRQNGLCTEIGPHGFRCDWGRVTNIDNNNKIVLKWQISPQRVPVPDPEKCSEVTVHFITSANSGVTLELQHTHFEKHGEGADQYQKAMDSPQGWDYILHCFVNAFGKE